MGELEGAPAYYDCPMRNTRGLGRGAGAALVALVTLACGPPISGSDGGADAGRARADAAADAAPPTDGSATETDGGVRSPGPIHFGFNAKGLVGTTQQVSYAEAMLGRYAEPELDGMVIRVLGGTISQKTYPSDWSDDAIRSWIDLQSRTGVGFVFTINGNDGADSQRAFYDRWVSLGARFTFIEMMNEYYLQKYLDGDISAPEVTAAVSPEDYASTIVPAYVAAFRDVGLPYFLILAPTGNGAAAQARNDHWNDTIIAAIGAHPEAGFGVTLHLYARGAGFDYAQVDRIRERLPAGTPVAVTEAGILDPSVVMSDAFPQASYDHLSAIYAHLEPGDYLLDQVLYTDYTKLAAGDPAPLVRRTDAEG